MPTVSPAKREDPSEKRPPFLLNNMIFLGIIFDKKLSFIPHINYLKAKCHKALQLLRFVAHTDWRADKSTLLKLYRLVV